MTALPRIGAPATRALNCIGIDTLEDVAARSATELANLHGFGPKAVRLIEEALTAAGLPALSE